MLEMWTCPEKTSIIELLLCLYWQAEYLGGRSNWELNMDRVKCIFNAILAISEL